MLLEQLLRESISAEDLVAMLKKHCKQFIAATNLPAYRGVDPARGLPVIDRRPIRKNRKPSDTPRPISQAIDRVMADIAGFKPRSEGLFVTGSSKVASLYGQLHLVFMIDDFKCVYSPLISDMYHAFDAWGLNLKILKPWTHSALRAAADEVFKDSSLAPFTRVPIEEVAIQYKNATKETRALFVEHFLNSIKKKAFVVGDLDKGLRSKKEVQLGGEEYFLINVEEMFLVTGLTVPELMQHLKE